MMSSENKFNGYVLRLTPEAGEAIRAQMSEDSEGDFARAAALLLYDDDRWPVGHSIGSTMRGVTSIIDSFIDPICPVRNALHKVFPISFSDGSFSRAHQVARGHIKMAANEYRGVAGGRSRSQRERAAS